MRVLPTRWRRKLAGIDMERNYVTVTLYIGIEMTAREWGGIGNVEIHYR